MLLKAISLKNIRSYNDGDETHVEFPGGIVLFEGDIGSGKSTILYGIEFALFGTAEVNGAYLLSERRQSGHVTLRFAIDGKDIVVRRGLVRKKETVAQEDCYIEEDGRRTPMSPADLKERVIEIMRFSEQSDPRAGSLVYRFAVFTPQEQMKSIVQKESEERFKILRRVLGILEYQVAADNSEIVEQRIKRDVYGLKRASQDFELKRSEASVLSGAISKLDSAIPSLERTRTAAAEALARLESESKELLSHKEAASNRASRTPELERRVKMLTAASKSAAEKAARLGERLNEEYIPFIEGFQSKRPPSEKTADSLESELEEKRKQREEKAGTIRVFQSQSKEVSELLSSGNCPRCGQRIDQGDFRGKLEHIRSEVESTKAELDAIDEECRRLASLHKLMVTYDQDSKRHDSLSKERKNLERDMSEAKADALRFDEELAESKRELETSRKEEGKLKELITELALVEKRLAGAKEEYEDANRELVQAVTQRDAKKGELERLNKEVEKMKSMREEAVRLGGYQSWLSDYFRPAVHHIEQTILVQMNARFNHHFQRLFSALVDDPDMSVRVTENFSPVLERQGFEQEYDALSGGERTSIALAYRLAINAIVHETSNSSIGELVILDEPTEGFSKEQIYKMRDILAEVGAKQVIIVSHEAELEAMAQHIFRVERVHGNSRIRPTQ
jgi:exonuclease SbcC